MCAKEVRHPQQRKSTKKCCGYRQVAQQESDIRSGRHEIVFAARLASRPDGSYYQCGQINTTENDKPGGQRSSRERSGSLLAGCTKPPMKVTTTIATAISIPSHSVRGVPNSIGKCKPGVSTTGVNVRAESAITMPLHSLHNTFFLIIDSDNFCIGRCRDVLPNWSALIKKRYSHGIV